MRRWRRATSSLPATEPLPVEHEFSSPPRAGLLFDVETGEILWERHPDRELPIASLTKMMTAWMIADRARARREGADLEGRDEDRRLDGRRAAGRREGAARRAC